METRYIQAERKITVIDGQPYYQSTGKFSGSPGLWFPFVMLKGTAPIYTYPKELSPRHLQEIFNTDKYDAYYLIKYEQVLLLPEYRELNFPFLINGRIPTKKTLITALRLTSEDNIFRQQLLLSAGLTSEEIDSIFNEPIKLAPQPDFTDEDPNKANAWIKEMGAIDVNIMLAEILTQPLEEDISPTQPFLEEATPSSVLTSCPSNMWYQYSSAVQSTGDIKSYTKYAL